MEVARLALSRALVLLQVDRRSTRELAKTIADVYFNIDAGFNDELAETFSFQR